MAGQHFLLALPPLQSTEETTAAAVQTLSAIQSSLGGTGRSYLIKCGQCRGNCAKLPYPPRFQDEACTATRCHFVNVPLCVCTLCNTLSLYVNVCFCAYFCALWMWIALLITVQNASLSSHQFTTVTPVPSSQSTFSLFVFCVCLFHHCLPSGAFVSQLVQWHRFSAEFTFHQFLRRARGRTSLPPMINKPMILFLYPGWTIYPAPVW